MSFLQATPEKCIYDPVMMGPGNRKRVLSHASFGADESVEEIVFEPVHPTVFCQKEDRCNWASYGWSKFTSDMKDRLIRNLASGYMLSYFDGMSGGAHIKSQILAEVNSHLVTPISFPIYAGYKFLG